jgi:hypothetical protein
LVEQAKRLDPDGKLAMIAEILNLEMGGILEEFPWLPSNDIWTHKTVRRSSLPNGTWRKLNTGVATEVSRTSEVLDVIGMLETYAEYDKEYIDNMPSPSVARMQEAKAFLEGLSQTLIEKILYGNANADPDQIHGLAPRLASIDGEFVINGGGTGSDVTSIFVVTPGPDTAFLIYPKNSPSLGIKHTDLGEVTITDATTSAPNTSQYQGYRDHFQVKCGFVVRHPKCIGRVANIETSGTSNTFDEDDLITLLNNMKIGPSTRIYCNQTILTQGQIRLKDKNNVNWTPEQGLGGMTFLRFNGIPVRMIDKQILLNTETAIS